MRRQHRPSLVQVMACLQCQFNRDLNLFIKKNAFENVDCKIVAIVALMC